VDAFPETSSFVLHLLSPQLPPASLTFIGSSSRLNTLEGAH
jgi:hypothetical protein